MAPVRHVEARYPEGSPRDRRMVLERPEPFDPSEPNRDGRDELQSGPPPRVFRPAGRMVLVRPAIRGPAPGGRAPAVHRRANEATRAVRPSRGRRDLASPWGG